MIYVVAGFMRSHTTMMMHCLEAGGMSTVWDSKRDEWAKEQGVEVNPKNEMREITNQTLNSFALHSEQFDGKLIKILTKYGYLRLPKWEYKVVLMIREPEEIRASFERVFGKPLVYTGDNGEEQPLTRELYFHLMASVASDLTEQNIPFIPLHSNYALKSPEGTFKYLKKQGWPIDPTLAAAVVQKKHQHVRVS